LQIRRADKDHQIGDGFRKEKVPTATSAGDGRHPGAPGRTGPILWDQDRQPESIRL
jgi:hypothetical protein